MQAGEEAKCPFQERCPVRSKWGRVQAAMLREMASINFADLSIESRSNPNGNLISLTSF
jgi:DNA-binding IscR family transcriptional regulator